MIVNFINQQSSLYIHSHQIHPMVERVILEEGQHCEEVNVYFVDTLTICNLHEQFFQDPTPTDCLSLPLDDENEVYRILGEVFICPETAISYAREHHLDPYEETSLYLVHSLLHLMGYDDIQPEDKQIMLEAESFYLEMLRTRHLLLRP